MTAVLFGSIGTIADTSELQRQAFNDAFSAHELDWHWTRDDYLALLQNSGGQKRIAAYADSVGQSVDARAVHASKSELFRKSLNESSLSPRAGVVETIRTAKDKGYKVALVTTTSRENVVAMVDALRPGIRLSDFDLVLDASAVAQPKPDRAAYVVALSGLGEDPGTCVAVEDNVDGVAAATAAGVRCVAFPNENTVGHDFGRADDLVTSLDLSRLELLVAHDGSAS